LRRIYFIHGRDVTDAVIPEVDVFDATAMSWSTLPLQLDGIMNYSDSAAFVIGTKIYVTGGWAPFYDYTLNTTIVLDTSDGTNAFKAGVVPSKSVTHGDLGANTVNGKGYVFGGFNLLGPQPLKSLEEYDPSTNTWTLKASFIHPRGDMASAVVGNELFVIGGEAKLADNTTSYAVGDVEQWDQPTNTWKERTPISETKFRFTRASWGSWIFDFGGQESEQTTVGGGIPYYPIDGHVFGLNTISSSSVFIPSPFLGFGLILMSLIGVFLF